MRNLSSRRAREPDRGPCAAGVDSELPGASPSTMKTFAEFSLCRPGRRTSASPLNPDNVMTSIESILLKPLSLF